MQSFCVHQQGLWCTQIAVHNFVSKSVRADVEEQRRRRMMDFVSYLEVEIDDSPEKCFQDYLRYYKLVLASDELLEGKQLRELT